MVKVSGSILMMLTVFLFSSFNDFPLLQGAYLGQEPPGMEAEIFAPGIISTSESEGCSVFSPDGKEFIFNKFRNSKTFIYSMKATKGNWSKPEITSFSSDHYDGDFTLSPDGNRLLFSSGRPLEEGGEPTRPSNLWVVERSGSGWSVPEALGAAINTKNHESYPTVTSDGALYFFSRGRGGLGKADLYVSRLVDGQYAEPENLGPIVNSEFEEYDPFVAADASYLIFASTRPSSLGKDDLYVSFKLEDGSWSTPVHMGEAVNSAASENRPYVTADGKYLFFTSNRKQTTPELERLDESQRPGGGNRDIYWVDARVIEGFKSRKSKKSIP